MARVPITPDNVELLLEQENPNPIIAQINYKLRMTYPRLPQSARNHLARQFTSVLVEKHQLIKTMKSTTNAPTILIELAEQSLQRILQEYVFEQE